MLWKKLAFRVNSVELPMVASGIKLPPPKILDHQTSVKPEAPLGGVMEYWLAGTAKLSLPDIALGIEIGEWSFSTRARNAAVTGLEAV